MSFDWKSLYKQLSAPMDAPIQETKKAETHKGYDTKGYGYQVCADAMNDKCGAENWHFDWNVFEVIKGSYRNGSPCIEVVVEVTVTIHPKGEEPIYRKCVGGHTSSNLTDAYKGAVTNGFKKTVAFWGVGAAAFRGDIDEDAVLPAPDSERTDKPFDGPMNGDYDQKQRANAPDPTLPFAKPEKLGEFREYIKKNKMATKCKNVLKNVFHIENSSLIPDETLPYIESYFKFLVLAKDAKWQEDAAVEMLKERFGIRLETLHNADQKTKREINTVVAQGQDAYEGEIGGTKKKEDDDGKENPPHTEQAEDEVSDN